MSITERKESSQESERRGSKTSQSLIEMSNAYDDISKSEAFCQLLQQALDEKEPVAIDASKVDYINTDVLQMLCAFITEAKSNNMQVQWDQPSEWFSDAVRLMGLSEILNFCDSSSH